MKSQSFRNALTLALLLTAAPCALAEQDKEPSTMPASPSLKIDNGLIGVEYSPATGVFSARRGKVRFLRAARLAPDGPGGKRQARVAAVDDVLGKGQAIEVACPAGRVATVAVYEHLPFVSVRLSVRNDSADDLDLATVEVLSAELDAGAPPAELGVVGTEGVHRADRDRDYYCYLAAADPNTRRGVVAGWATHEMGSGIVGVRGKAEPFRLVARSEYGTKLVRPGQAVQGETLLVGLFDDALLGLEAYADAAARANRVRLPARVPSGYCTWYHARALDEKRMAQLAEFCQAEKLTEYGLEFLQIDDGWQVSGRDFTTFHPKGSYRGGMKQTAENITKHGLTAGLWLIPFGWDHKRPAFADHQDWFMKAKDGSVLPVRWAGDCLDCTNPATREFLRGVIRQIVDDWGYRYLKIDGLWSGMGPKILYPAGHYRPDDLGRMVLHDRTKSPVEAYREGLRLVREAAGRKTFVLGCNCAQNYRTLGASFGLLDGMRVGPDLTARWSALLRPARTASVMYFLHGRMWFNDPDCLMLRDPLTLDQARAWASMIAISGQLNIVSEWLPGLPADKLDVLKRTLPNSQACGRPLDLFGRDRPRVWHLSVAAPAGRRDVVALINWDEKRPANLSVAPSDFGLPAGRYVFFENWTQKVVGESDTAYKTKLPPSSCQVLSVVPADGRPRFLGSTRHVLGGVVDLSDIRWADGVLSAAFRGVSGREDRLAVHVPAGWTPAGARAGGQDVATSLDGRVLTVTVQPERPGALKLTVRFQPAR